MVAEMSTEIVSELKTEETADGTRDTMRDAMKDAMRGEAICALTAERAEGKKEEGKRVMKEEMHTTGGAREGGAGVKEEKGLPITARAGNPQDADRTRFE